MGARQSAVSPEPRAPRVAHRKDDGPAQDRMSHEVSRYRVQIQRGNLKKFKMQRHWVNPKREEYDQFRFLRVVCLANLKGSVGLVYCVFLLSLKNLLWAKLRDYVISRVKPNPRQVFLLQVVKLR